MRVLASAVLTFEWIVLALAIPVAVNVAGVDPAPVWMVFAAATVLIVAALALLRTPAGVWLGWSVQVLALLSGIVVPLLAVMGAIFAGLYYAAIRLGTKVDRIKAARLGEGGADTAPAAGTMAEPDNRP
jgi:hypothetical protein